jgi:endonuclease/exonuclease/phosphatase family metal-dependent hydrolase
VFTLATFNVKDLFDTSFAEKLDELARHLTRADADVVCFQEIGSEEALRLVLSRVPGGERYGAPIFGTPDKRGIRNALASRLPVTEKWVHTAREVEFPRFVSSDPSPFPGRIPLRRGIVQARVSVPVLGPVDVLVMHFKSKRGTRLTLPNGTEVEPGTQRERAECDLRSLVSRAGEALFVRGLVDKAEGENPRVCVVGDLNDTIDSVPVRIVAGRGDGRLHSVASVVPPDLAYSAMHGAEKNQIDHILVSQPMRDVLDSAQFFNEELKDSGPYMEEAPPTVESDHALFVARFKSD